MNPTKHHFREVLAIELVIALAHPDRNNHDIVIQAFDIAKLVADKIESEREQAATAASLKKAEAMAQQSAQMMRQDEILTERRKAGGISVTETDDVREILDLLRKVMQ